MKRINLTVVKLITFLILGILSSHYFNLPLPILKVTVIVAFVLLLLAWLRAKHQLFQDAVFGIAAYFTFFFAGAVVYQLHQPENHESHYSQIVETSESGYFQFKIRDVLKPDLYNHKYIARVIAVDGKPASGKVLLLVSKDSLDIENSELNIDDLLLIKTKVNLTTGPKNPFQFDYANYLKTQGVYHQVFVGTNEILLIIEGTKTLKGYAGAIRDHINTRLKENNFQKDELALINAILLGQRREMSKEVFNDFAAAGAVHILAVSGLHVGILMLLLSFLLRPLEYYPQGRTIKLTLIILFLWIFAIIAGLSPSVLRAVTMFSFLAYALQSRRETSSYTTLFLSALVLLMFNPNMLFHIGFQLSYLAVFAILWIQPLLYRLYRPRSYLDKLLWGTATVSVAAQLGILPLSLYYFNQFPGLFLLTNIVILPFLGIVLGLGIGVIILASYQILPKFLAAFYETILSYLIEFISWVARQDTYFFDDISFTRAQVLVFYLLLIALVMLWQNLSAKNLVFVCLAVIVTQAIFFWNKISYSEQELVIFQKNRNTLIGYKSGNELTVFSGLDSIKLSAEGSLKSYRTARGIINTDFKEVPNVFVYSEKLFLVVDSLGIYNLPEIKPDIIILRKSPKIHLGRLIDSLQPKRIIADGSNYPSYVQRWDNTCLDKKIVFHHTGARGALVIND